MTFSIVAWDEPTGMLGVAVSTKFLAVGSLCVHARAGVGAIATQAMMNPTFGPRGLALLEQGIAVQDTLNALLNSDAGREYRQIHAVDARGNTAGFTGSETLDWAGHRCYPHFSVAGNILVGSQVLEAMTDAYQTHATVGLPERLLRALEAGQAAGGDKRGRQSAALYIVTTEVYPYLDLRVDDHPDPVAELRRIYEEAKREFLPFAQFMATKTNPSGIYDRAERNAILARQAQSG